MVVDQTKAKLPFRLTAARNGKFLFQVFCVQFLTLSSGYTLQQFLRSQVSPWNLGPGLFSCKGISWSRECLQVMSLMVHSLAGGELSSISFRWQLLNHHGPSSWQPPHSKSTFKKKMKCAIGDHTATKNCENIGHSIRFSSKTQVKGLLFRQVADRKKINKRISSQTSCPIAEFVVKSLGGNHEVFLHSWEQGAP